MLATDTAHTTFPGDQSYTYSIVRYINNMHFQASETCVILGLGTRQRTSSGPNPNPNSSSAFGLPFGVGAACGLPFGVGAACGLPPLGGGAVPLVCGRLERCCLSRLEYAGFDALYALDRVAFLELELYAADRDEPL